MKTNQKETKLLYRYFKQGFIGTSLPIDRGLIVEIKHVNNVKLNNPVNFCRGCTQQSTADLKRNRTQNAFESEANYNFIFLAIN